jgi:putative addiction module component (TIGR02574 family)
MTIQQARVIFQAMRTAEILEELARLSKQDREVIRLKLADLDGDGWDDADDPLSDADKALIQSRVEAHERDSSSAIPWEQFDEVLKRRLGMYQVLHTARHEHHWQKRV